MCTQHTDMLRNGWSGKCSVAIFPPQAMQSMKLVRVVMRNLATVDDVAAHVPECAETEHGVDEDASKEHETNRVEQVEHGNLRENYTIVFLVSQ